jgi:hypothetical protein
MKTKSKPKSLRELCPALYESPKQKRARHKRLVALFKSPLFTEDTEGNAEAYKELMKSISESRGYKVG